MDSAKRAFNLLLLTVLCGGCLHLTCPGLKAATQYGVVTGSVYDQNFKPLPGATVRLINSSTGFSQAQACDSNGYYTFAAVPPAEGYLLSAEARDFQSEFRQNLEVTVADNKLVQPPFLLQPVQAATAAARPAPPTKTQAPSPVQEKGKAPQAPAPAHPAPPTPAPAQPTPPPVPAAAHAAVAPSPAAAPAPSISLDLVSSTLGGVVDTRAVHTLPLKFRDFLDLALLLPGTFPVEQGSALTGASLVVNGARADMNNFLLDGTDNNDYTINQSLPFQIVEALQEFRVQTSTSSAEYGRSGGAQINSVSRRGFNSVHGTLFEFLRNSALNQDNLFSVYNGGTFDEYVRQLELFGFGNALGDPVLGRLYDRPRSQLAQNQFGGNIGGPLRRDKLFGFFNWESLRVSNPRPLFESVPGEALRSALQCPSFVNNFFPFDLPGLAVTSCDPNARAINNLYPAPDVPPSTLTFPFPTFALPDGSPLPFTDPNFNSFFIGESSNSTRTDNFLERLDWRKSDRVSMSFKHNIQGINQTQGGTMPKTAFYPGNGAKISGRNQNFSYNYVQQLTSRTLNEFRLGWNRFRLDQLAEDRSVDPTSLGFSNLNFLNQGLPTISYGGKFSGAGTSFSTLGAALSAPSRRADNLWSLADNLSLVRGRHNWKLGIEYRYARLDVLNQALGRGLLSFFSGPFVAGTGSPDVASIARVSPDFGGGFDRDFRSQSVNGFAQDQWRPRSNLTFNYGVRYEVNTAPVESRNRLVNYYPALGGLVRAGSKTIFDAFGNTIRTAPSTAPRAGFETDMNNWSPRVGFAWSPGTSGKTVVRGGFAVMFDQQPFEPSVNMLLNPPFVEQWASLSSTFPQIFPPGFPGSGTQLNPNNLLSILSFSGQGFMQPYSITARDPNSRTPYAEQFNFGIQRRLGSQALIEADYIGLAAHKLPRTRDMSPCSLKFLDQELLANPSGSLASLDCVLALPGASPFLPTSIINQENSANSNFHSLLVRFETRSFRGLQMESHYQFSKSIDDATSQQPPVLLFTPPQASLFTAFFTDNPDAFAGLNSVSPTLSLRPELAVVSTRPLLPQDSSNLRAERALSDFDVRHRFVVSFVYDLPAWQQLRALGRGWQLAGIGTVESGQPFTVFEDFFGTPVRPNLLKTPKIDNATPGIAIDNANPIAFRPCVPISATCTNSSSLAINFDPNTFLLLPGTLGRNTFIGPKLANLDFAILKNTSFRERYNVQFRVEFFNATNASNLRQPYSKGGVAFLDQFGFFSGSRNSLVFFNPFYGKVLQAQDASEIHFAIKFTF